MPEDYPGTFIVLEGSDGSGKGTQFKLLGERLKAAGYDVETFDFPRYDQPSSHFVQRYLNGDYGPASQISPYSASLFYALDRFEAAPLIRKALQAGKIVLSNRYVGSNMAHQGAKFTNQAEQRGFFIWEDGLEYQLLAIPRPTANLFLRVPAEVSQILIKQRAKANGTKLDQHELDLNHLRRSVETYDTLCQLFPRDFQAIDCTQAGRLLSVPEISDHIWHAIKPMLPQKASRPGRATTVKFNEQSAPKVTKDQKTAELKPQTAKLSLLGLIELAKNGNLPLEGLEMGAKQPEYYTPNLPPELLKNYNQFMKKLAANRQKIEKIFDAKKPTGGQEVLEMLVPMATYCYLQTDDKAKIHEPKLAAKANRAQKQLEKLAQDQITVNISVDQDPVTLLEAWPRNEFSLLSDSLYGVSDLPRQQVQAGIENWSYEQKYQVLNTVLTDIEPALAQQVRYRLDVVAEAGLILELLLSGLGDGLQLQTLTPRYGYAVPASIEEAGLTDEFIECFDISLEIFSQLQASDNPQLAAYATLAGHRARFQFSCSLESLIKLPKGRSDQLNGLLEQLLLAISANQPIIAESLRRKLQDAPKKSKSARRRRSNKSQRS